MTTLVAAVPSDDPDADIRWREWQARGVDADRQRLATLARVGLLIALAVTIWFMAPLT